MTSTSAYLEWAWMHKCSPAMNTFSFRNSESHLSLNSYLDVFAGPVFYEHFLWAQKMLNPFGGI